MHESVDIYCFILVMALLEDSDQGLYRLAGAGLTGAERDMRNTRIMKL